MQDMFAVWASLLRVHTGATRLSWRETLRIMLRGKCPETSQPRPKVSEHQGQAFLSFYLFLLRYRICCWTGLDCKHRQRKAETLVSLLVVSFRRSCCSDTSVRDCQVVHVTNTSWVRDFHNVRLFDGLSLHGIVFSFWRTFFLTFRRQEEHCLKTSCVNVQVCCCT